ncbi:hypothetical protein N657DRAFT_694486 [Parathielavia appendiculata]|uniref:Uncharacterized protein n=1 Tax=Parathielavia appendiculata TaxID=2587402 RepID=A0AAN6TPI0_9PEZI|nr:hypothetical protein N657DRAFT_694486 [Parathielavia appendiculata]
MRSWQAQWWDLPVVIWFFLQPHQYYRIRKFSSCAPSQAAGGNARGQGQGESRPRGAREAAQAQFEALAQAINEKDEAAAALIGEQSRLSANMWVRRTGWPRHLQGFDCEWLAATTRRPDAEKGATSGGNRANGDKHGHRDGDQDREQDRDRDRDDAEEEASRGGSEAALAIVLLAMERVVWRAQKASQASVVGSAAVNSIERREAGGNSYEKPFNAGQKGATMVKYSAAEGEEEEEQEERGDGDQRANGQVEGGEPERIRDRRPAYNFTAEQAEMFDRVRIAVYAAIAGGDGSDTNHDDEDDTSELEGHRVGRVGHPAGRGWRSALVYTPVLSAIVTVARMLVLHKAKRARHEEIRRRRRFAGESKAKARERARSHFDRVREMVQRFMTIFSIVSLQAMIHGLLHAARAQLRRAVLLLDVDEDGEPVTTARQGAGEPAGAMAWPAIQWDKLVDNAAETKAGWSFAEDPRNREAFGGVDGKRWLADRVVGEARLFRQFFETEAATIGGREDGSGIRWRMERVREYAEAMEAFRAQLLVLMHMTGGQPARGTELVTVKYKFIPFS